jgi:G3E family GTPase
MSATTPHSTPTMIVGGYLGAGKTTYVNALLANNDGLRIAVMVNDFGTLSIDAELIANTDGSTWSLANGCACCEVGDDLATALQQVADTSPPFDLVVIEASGVALPDRMRAMCSLPGLHDEGTVVLVDATDIGRLALDKYVSSIVKRQIQRADAIIVTKTDLASPEQANRATDIVNSLRGDIPVVGDDHDDPHAAVDVELSPQTLDELKELFTHCPSGVVRAKGFVARKEGGSWLVHYASGRLDASPSDHAPTMLTAIYIAALLSATKTRQWLTGQLDE